jgi:glutamine synthetase
MPYQAEYIWIDGHQPTPQLRSKTKILKDSVKTPPIWGFDGSSTEQATGDKSDCMLKPVFTCKDPIRGGKNILVLPAHHTPPTPVLRVLRWPRSTPPIR